MGGRPKRISRERYQLKQGRFETRPYKLRYVEKESKGRQFRRRLRAHSDRPCRGAAADSFELSSELIVRKRRDPRERGYQLWDQQLR